jgi:hypothetical protein
MIFITPIIIAKIMGNAFLNAPIFYDESPFVTWHVGVMVIGTLILRKAIGLCIYKYRNICNRAQALKMITERNDKLFEFKSISADELKTMDVT